VCQTMSLHRSRCGQQVCSAGCSGRVHGTRMAAAAAQARRLPAVLDFSSIICCS
jgi:hypothetical protein